MANADDDNQGDLFIDFDDDDKVDPKKKPDDKAATEDKPKAPAKSDAVELMKQRLEKAKADAEAVAAAERAKRTEAERVAAERATELEQVRESHRAVEGDAIASAKGAAVAEANGLQEQLAKAWEDGEYGKAAELQRKLARAEAVLLQLDQREASHKEEAIEKKAEPEKKPQTTAPSDLESWLSSVQLSDRAKAWFREHPDAFSDKEKFFGVQAAHAAAQKGAIAFDSDDYYSFINKRLGYVKDASNTDDDAGDDDVEIEAEEKPKRAPAAPVSRGQSGQGSSPNSVRLSRAEVEMAEAMGMDPKTYAKNKLALIKKGELQI